MEFYLKRILEEKIKPSLSKGKVVVLLGSRRVGKTVLVQQLLAQEKNHFLLNGEDITTHELLERRSVQNYKNLLAGKSLLVIDEAQEIPSIGAILKLIIDAMPQLQILVTGSSAYALEHNLGEPLTGRQRVFKIFPFSELELGHIEPPTQRFDNLMQRLVFGSYPEVYFLNTEKEKTQYLSQLVHSYLLKDILAFENIRNSNKILNLLKLIALQLGREVSLQELGRQLAMSKNTVEKYLDILCKAFVLYRLGGFSRNLRKEITKTSRWYFMDNGIRNTLIANLSPISNRTDQGMLWENYIVSERIKHQNYQDILANNYFWRTYDQQEIDWIEEKGGKLNAYEFKFSPTNKVKPPVAWAKAYPNSSFETIHSRNYLDSFFEYP